MEKVNWRHFWQTYRRAEIQTEDDLFFEVGKTVDQRPISKSAFKQSIELIASDLDLKSNDILLELCCGNGLMSLPLASLVSRVYAVDFAHHLINNARRFRPAPNIDYVCADAVSYMTGLATDRSYIPSKILLGDALCYFEPDSLGHILKVATELTDDKVAFLASGVPSDELKWNFYNTPERIRRYEENQQLEGNTNDGIGRWWREEELQSIASDLKLELWVTRQPPSMSNFRVNALFRSRE